MNESDYMILNGERVIESAASITPLNRGLMYGDGCFETLRCYSGTFLRWDSHFKRLSDGLAYLGIECPFTSNELKKQVLELVRKNDLRNEDAMIRLQCWRNGGRGFSTQSTSASWMVQATAYHQTQKRVKLTLAETRCIPSEALERKYKLTNSLNYIKAAQEAREASCDDALMLTISDKVSENTRSNIFWITDNKVYTPSADCDLLPGITRGVVIDVIHSLGIPIQVGVYDEQSIMNATAAFCTNSLMEIAEVHSLDEVVYESDNPVLMKIKKGFEQLKTKELRR